MLISTSNSVMPRDFPPHNLYFSSLSKLNEILSTFLPHVELMTSPELKSCVIQNEILGKLASREGSATHLTLLHKNQSSQRDVGRTGALGLLSSILCTSSFLS